jgi:TRAP-type C4-dicarboxylate transport system permease small subunit
MKLERIIDLGIPIICGMLLVLLVSVTFAQIVLRNFFDSGLAWYDEVAQFFMTWMVLVSAIWLTKNNQHLNTGLKLHRKLNQSLIYLIDGILDLLVAGIVTVVAYQTAIYAFVTMSIKSMTLSWLKMGCVFIILPIAMLGVFYYYLKNFFKIISLFSKKIENK